VPFLNRTRHVHRACNVAERSDRNAGPGVVRFRRGLTP